MESKKLKNGEKFLSISLDSAKMLALSMKAVNDGEHYVQVPAFKNYDKEKDTDVAFQSFGVKVWINTKQDKEHKDEL